MSECQPHLPEDLPNSAKLVWMILDYNGPLTPVEIVDRFNLARSTVYDALDYLDPYLDWEPAAKRADSRVYYIQSEYRTKAEVKDT